MALLPAFRFPASLLFTVSVKTLCRYDEALPRSAPYLLLLTLVY
jgi:hypothetical protein